MCPGAGMIQTPGRSIWQRISPNSLSAGRLALGRAGWSAALSRGDRTPVAVDGLAVPPDVAVLSPRDDHHRLLFADVAQAAMGAGIDARETARAQSMGGAVPEADLHLAAMHEVQLLLLVVKVDARAVPGRQDNGVYAERVNPERLTDLAKPGTVTELIKAADGVSGILAHGLHPTQMRPFPEGAHSRAGATTSRPGRQRNGSPASVSSAAAAARVNPIVSCAPRSTELADPEDRIMLSTGFGWQGPAFVLDRAVVWGYTDEILAALQRLGGWARPWVTCSPVDLDQTCRRAG